MNTTKLYYTPPEDKLFDELKDACMELWKIVDSDNDNDKYGYATEKIKIRIKDIKNVGDNFMYMVEMFDMNNQAALTHLISDECSLAIGERMIDGGTPEFLVPFKY